MKPITKYDGAYDFYEKAHAYAECIKMEEVIEQESNEAQIQIKDHEMAISMLRELVNENDKAFAQIRERKRKLIKQIQSNINDLS